MRMLLFVLVLLLAGLPASAETLVVRPDGTGPFPTIQAAIDAAVNGDVVELTEGTFTGDGNRDLDFLAKTITLASASGNPATCILDCAGNENEPHRAFHIHGGGPEGTEVSGITITGGYVYFDVYDAIIFCEGPCTCAFRTCVFSANQGGVLVSDNDCVVTMVDCIFQGNSGFRGAIHCGGTTLTLTRCHFSGNSGNYDAGAVDACESIVNIRECSFSGNSGDTTGAVRLFFSTSVALEDCLFEDNVASSHGAIQILYSNVTIEGCTFVRNRSDWMGGALWTDKMAYVHLRNCTFWGNGSLRGTMVLGQNETTLENCIIAASTAGPAIHVAGVVELSCCDLWGNPGGDWVGGIEGQYGIRGNISEDPQFCDAPSGDYTLAETSPCAPFSPPNPECDLIGAWPVACGGTPVDLSSWGEIKARFRR
jgi:hypothetical protein